MVYALACWYSRDGAFLFWLVLSRSWRLVVVVLTGCLENRSWSFFLKTNNKVPLENATLGEGREAAVTIEFLLLGVVFFLLGMSLVADWV